MDLEKYAKDLYERVKETFPDQELKVSNVFDFIRIAMEEAEKFIELDGRQKKELVIRVLHEAFEDYVVDEAESESLRILVDSLVEVVIDQFVDIDLNHLHLNEDQKHRIRAWFKKACPCVGTRA